MNDRQVEALADAMEQYAIKRDSMGFVPNFSIEGKEKILQVAAALRSRTPSAPDVALREISLLKAEFGHTLAKAQEIANAALSASEAKAGEPVTLTYTNYRGETALRTIRPKSIRFGSTEWHPEPQWLLLALDVEKNADREFALKDFGAPTPQVDREAVARIVDPDAWSAFDNNMNVVARPAERNASLIDSFERADAILSLLAPAQEDE